MSLLLKHLALTEKELSESNVGKLLLVSVILAYKYVFDQPVEAINSYFASISGLSLHEVNQLEMKYLKEMEFRSFIST